MPRFRRFRRRFGRRFGRRRSFRPTSFRRTGGSFGRIRSLPELKVTETLSVTLPTSTLSTQISLMNGIAAGSDYSQRLGRKVTIKSIYLLLNVHYVDGAAQDAPQGHTCRMWIVLDTQANGTTPTFNSMFASATSVSTTMNNLDQRMRFKILKDMRFTLPPYDGTGATAFAKTLGTFTGSKVFKIFKKVRIPVIYNATGGSIGSISTNAIHLVFASQANGNGNVLSNVAWDLSYRLRFVDD